MAEKISFQELQTICQALGEFADARSESQPDKDVILTVTKIDGRETLQATRLSEMSWFARIIRWFGFGGATVYSVAEFLQSNEPYIPRSFSRLQDRVILEYHYSDDAIDELTTLDKETYRELKHQKRRGCEIFKRCVSHHNELHCSKAYILLQENERTNLEAWLTETVGGITYSSPNPMGRFPAGDENKIRERFKHPIIDQNEFLYLKPFFNNAAHVSPNVLGFCYEYGLGTKPNHDEALKNYREAADKNEYSACYNLGRMLFEQGDVNDAIDALKKGEDILIDRIDNANDRVYHIQNDVVPGFGKAHPQTIKDATEFNEGCQKVWQKDLNRIHLVLIEAYRSKGDDVTANDYEQKIEAYQQSLEQDIASDIV